MFAVACSSAVARQIESRSTDVSCKATLRSRECEQCMRRNNPMCKCAREFGSNERRDVTIAAVEIDGAGNACRRTGEHAIVETIVAQFDLLPERAEDPAMFAQPAAGLRNCRCQARALIDDAAIEISKQRVGGSC